MPYHTELDTFPDGNKLQRQQYQKQRQQQQQEAQQHPYVTPGRELPDKQHQLRHNPVSEGLQFPSHSCDQ